MSKAINFAILVAGLTALAGAAARAEEKITIGISNPNLAFPFAAALQRAGDAACKALDMNCLSTDAALDTERELRNVEGMLGKGIQCLDFVAASLDASVSSIQAANKKGVPVVQFNG